MHEESTGYKKIVGYGPCKRVVLRRFPGRRRQKRCQNEYKVSKPAWLSEVIFTNCVTRETKLCQGRMVIALYLNLFIFVISRYLSCVIMRETFSDGFSVIALF